MANVYFSIRQSASPGMGNVHSSNAFSLGFKVYHVLGDIFPIATKRQYARDRGIQRA